MYEVHTTQKSTSIHPGDTLDLDYSVMHSFLGGEKRVQLGWWDTTRGKHRQNRPDDHAGTVEGALQSERAGCGSNLNLSAKINVGFKYFQEFANRSTFQGHSIQFSGSIKF